MMRSRKIAAVIYTLILMFAGIGTTAKSATMENVLTAIHSNYQPASISDMETAKQDEIICLALNQYHEARGSTAADIMAVGFSTRNRVTKSASKSYCSTIWERGQYVWTKRPVKGILPKENAA
jgi:spore germination cell wall hydrolase CwlJ-like protein